MKENEDGQKVNRDNTHMNLKLNIPDQETMTIVERSGDGGFN